LGKVLGTLSENVPFLSVNKNRIISALGAMLSSFDYLQSFNHENSIVLGWEWGKLKNAKMHIKTENVPTILS